MLKQHSPDGSRKALVAAIHENPGCHEGEAYRWTTTNTATPYHFAFRLQSRVPLERHTGCSAATWQLIGTYLLACKRRILPWTCCTLLLVRMLRALLEVWMARCAAAAAGSG